MLFQNSKHVVVLSDKDFNGNKIKPSAFRKAGVIFCYATWCPHCQSKVKSIETMAKNNKTMSIYVIEADQNKNAAQAIGVQYFPTIKTVSATGQIGQEVEYQDLINQKGGKHVPAYTGLKNHKIGSYVMFKNGRVGKIIKNKNNKKSLVFA